MRLYGRSFQVVQAMRRVCQEEHSRLFDLDPAEDECVAMGRLAFGDLSVPPEPGAATDSHRAGPLFTAGVGAIGGGLVGRN
jgi:hypothetical protein